MTNCPSCGDKFDNKRDMSIHHKLSHGSSLIEETSSCKVDGCDNVFSYYPSNKEGKICPKCIQNGKNVYEAGLLDEEDISIPDNHVEYEDVSCYNCGKEGSVPPSRISGDEYLCSRKCLDEYNSERMEGENNPRYKDGESIASEYDRDWRKVREKAIQRDNNSCCLCESHKNLHVHHLKPVRTFDDPKNAHFLSNAISLCASCHPKVEHGKTDIPRSLMDEKNLIEPDTIF
jgi:5-methylcytosine-specific restriction endonuclease McrA